jgi:hypothetical protein
MHHHFIDSILPCVSAIVVASATAVVSEIPSSSVERMDILLFMLPFVGAMITTAGCWLMNPAQETRKITFGRCVFALFCGAMAPSIIVAIWPSLAPYNVKPPFLVAVGAFVAFLFYVLSKPFTFQFYARADGLGRSLADQVARKIPGVQVDDAQPPTTKLPLVIAGLLCCTMLPSCGLTSSEWLAIGRDVALREAPIVYGQVQTVKANRTAAKQPHAVIP